MWQAVWGGGVEGGREGETPHTAAQRGAEEIKVEKHNGNLSYGAKIAPFCNFYLPRF